MKPESLARPSPRRTARRRALKLPLCRAWRRTVRLLRRGLAATARALERAEKRITDNFRVPPHGG